MAEEKDPEIANLELEALREYQAREQGNIQKAQLASLPPNWRDLQLDDPRITAPPFQLPAFNTEEGLKARGLFDENGNATKLGEDYILLEDRGLLADGQLTDKAKAFLTDPEDLLPTDKYGFSGLDMDDPEVQEQRKLFGIRWKSGIDEKSDERSILDNVLGMFEGIGDTLLSVGTAMGGPRDIGAIIANPPTAGAGAGDLNVTPAQQAAAAESIVTGAIQAPPETLNAAGAFVHKYITGRGDEESQIDYAFQNQTLKALNKSFTAGDVLDAVLDTTVAAETRRAAQSQYEGQYGKIAGESMFNRVQSGGQMAGSMVTDPLNIILAGGAVAAKAVPASMKAFRTASSLAKVENASATMAKISEAATGVAKQAENLKAEIPALQKLASDASTIGKADEARTLYQQAQTKTAQLEEANKRLAQLEEGFQVNQGVRQKALSAIESINAPSNISGKAAALATNKIADAVDGLGNATAWAAKGVKKIERGLGFHKIPWMVKVGLGIPYGKAAAAYYGVRAGLIYGAPALKKLAQFGRTMSEEMLQLKGTSPFWRRVAANESTGRLGQAFAGLMDFTTPLQRGIASPIKGAAQVLPITALYESINSSGLDQAALERAGANALVFGPLARIAGSGKQLKEGLAGDFYNFRNKLKNTDPAKFQAFEGIPSKQAKQFVASFDAAYPKMFDYNFTNSGNSFFDPTSKTITLNVNDTPGMVKALAGHEINHALQFIHQSDGAVVAKMLGSDGVNGLVRDAKGNLDPEFKAWGDQYNSRLKAQGLPEKPVEDLAIEYYTDIGAQTLFEDVVSGKMFKAAQKSKVRRRIEEMFSKTMSATPIVKELHFKLGGATDGYGRMVMGSGLLADGIREIPEVKTMVRNMYRESSGLPSKQKIAPNDRPSRSSDPNHHRAGDVIKTLNDEAVKNKTPLVEGVLHPDAKGNGAGRLPSEYFEKLEADGVIPEGSWGLAVDINENIDEAIAYLLDYRPIEQGRSPQIDGKTLNNIKPVGWVLNDGRLYLAAMDLNQLNANIAKAAKTDIAKKLKMSETDIMNDIDAVADLYAKNKPTDDYFKQAATKSGYADKWQSRKNFINAVQGLMTSEQLAKNPMFHALQQTKRSGIYRTFAFDRLDNAVRVTGKKVVSFSPNSYYNLKANFMPQMPNVNRKGEIIAPEAIYKLNPKIDSNSSAFPFGASGSKIKTILKFSKSPIAFEAQNAIIESPAIRYLPQDVMHASPHLFDKFSLEKIGTGEGAQAYAWGLYFAENPKVSGRGGSYDLQFERKFGKPSVIYTVKLKPSSESFLDWHKPLNEQSEAVKNALSRYIEKGYGTERGQDIYNIVTRYSPKNGQVSPQYGSEKLKSLGISGIRYLDAESRFLPYKDIKKDVSYNYVVFDVDDIEIIKRDIPESRSAEK